MTPRALAWAWLQALPARPFALLETGGGGSDKRLSLAAGEPLFVFEGRGTKARLRCGGRTWALALPPEQALEALGKGLARRSGGRFWPLLLALGYEAGRRFERLPRPKPARPAASGRRNRSLGLPEWWAFLPGLWAVRRERRRGDVRNNAGLRRKGAARAHGWTLHAEGLDFGLARTLARSLGLPVKALDPARAAPELACVALRAALRRAAEEPEPGGPGPDPGPRSGSLDLRATRTAYLRAVRRAREYILDGDIYQANLAHRFAAPWSGEPFHLYQRLMRVNPSPMAAYVDLGKAQVVSASPERLFRVQGRRVETWPIAGTAPRLGRPGEREALRASAKDAAEHVMLVDLERNDLGRVCVGGGVRVARLGEVQSFSHVHHLVSRVVGRLKPGLGLPDLLRAGFPGGSITGAPKIRCMEIIRELEAGPRGWYTGSLGWWDPKSGRADLNILIRTLFVRDGRAQAQVGAGIVLDSKPEAEWRETLAKAEALFKALGVSVKAGA